LISDARSEVRWPFSSGRGDSDKQEKSDDVRFSSLPNVQVSHGRSGPLALTSGWAPTPATSQAVRRIFGWGNEVTTLENCWRKSFLPSAIQRLRF